MFKQLPKILEKEIIKECESIYNDLLDRDALYSPKECEDYVSNWEIERCYLMLITMNRLYYQQKYPRICSMMRMNFIKTIHKRIYKIRT
jgi:hypothetical protein